MQANIPKLPDTQIRHAVLRQLEWEPEVSHDQIGVGVMEGVVTLTGQVDTYAEKIAAERTTKRVYGVKAIANDLQVRPVGVRTDTEIAADAVRSLEAHVSAPASQIILTVRDGWVTLEGSVDWMFQKEAAESAVQYLGGVRGIDNQITVIPKVSSAEVSELIEEALIRNAEVEASRIRVETHNGVITLSGTVDSWTEKEEAERASWSAPGVSRVVNHIVIAPESIFYE
ncbi:MAG: BON domain-containing protein [Acidobacteria bacterium]|nr:BON domain-containing protein [Acidobacteriota bacterium]